MNNVQICAVTKGRSIAEIEKLLKQRPDIKIIAENRWPDCEEKFLYFKNYEKHFIGPLQRNKVKKVVPLIDVIQSVDSLSLLEKISHAAVESNKKIKFCFQVNISQDATKQGISVEDLEKLIKKYEQESLSNVELIGLMTIGSQTGQREYFKKFKQLFSHINKKYFFQKPLKILSMGMSEDYQIAIEEGATMVRLGRILFV